MKFKSRAGKALVLMALAFPLAAAAGLYRTPRQTVRTFAKALESDNVSAMQACIITRKSVQAQLMKAIFMRQAAQYRLERAARKAFGRRRALLFDVGNGSTRQQMRQALKSLRSARLIVHGSRAQLIAGHNHVVRKALPPMYFRKIGDNWKIDASHGLKATTRNAKRRLALAARFDTKLGAAINRTAVDIKANRFKHARTAKTALMRRLGAIVRWYRRQHGATIERHRQHQK
jgi:hypothetical protein